VLDTAINIGKSAAHSLMPDNYEYYLCSLELFDSDSNKVGFLSFTVMPEQLVESTSPIQTIMKTHGGIVTNYNSSFNPIDITLSGTFGRKFRLASNYIDPSANTNNKFNFSLNFGKILGVEISVKSGYGLIKVLHHILKLASNGVDSKGKPYFLCFNNYAFNTSYVVNVMNYQFTQSSTQNMIWYYNLSMRAVSNRYENQFNKLSKLLKNVTSSAMSGFLNKMVTNMKNS
jgi:hypothetical protein